MPFRRRIEGGDLCAIYVHAGAGYHSTSNEKNHLNSVNDAARVAMALLKNGADAVEAVEMAIRLLEDREITNAGFGSNLTIDGHVECDACLVDHFGRSGAVGAIAQVKNPITVARLVLDASTQPLSLQRVPPNLLVGPGAIEFAADHGVPILPHDYLVSEGARARWIGWKKDLIAAEAKAADDFAQKSKSSMSTSAQNFKSAPRPQASPFSNPSPPISPDHPLSRHPDPSNISRFGRPPSECRIENSQNKSQVDDDDGDESATDDTLATIAAAHFAGAKRQRVDGSTDGHNLHSGCHNVSTCKSTDTGADGGDRGKDHITDTVGAIAIDCYGRIAAGSSSGGIGMKHRGRCGPAALVGIGTAVIPADPDDPERAFVATVTSGTGEHMATTAAAHTAADRIRACVRKRHGTLETCSEDEAIYSVIKNDFMKHPGVFNSPCTGAIGILCVKKTMQGVYFYFAHNTDSFAIASMHSNERKPVCVMSRSKGNGSIAQGARKGRATRTSKH